ncbi:MAG: hypothetical protein EOP48_30070 [Sphingobacteriales bacterium]|nr:MAG: hypothetical protein EOP48_30070 [Sphingobacteriales bacterium]
MKTNLKTSILAIALLASVTGAFASDISNLMGGKSLAGYNWRKVDETTQQPIGPIVPGTEANPFLNDCDGETDVVCAQGTPQSAPTGPATLFYYYD